MKVLAVDVGLRIFGYVLCEVKNLEIEIIKESAIKPRAQQALGEKLEYIFNELEMTLAEYKPQAIIAEKLYSHHRHPTTLGILAQVRGIVVLLAQQRGISFFEYSSTRARKSFLGRGSVRSDQVKRMAENVTGKKFHSQHAADAFSLVVAFTHTQKLKNILLRANC